MLNHNFTELFAETKCRQMLCACYKTQLKKHKTFKQISLPHANTPFPK